MTPRNSKSFVLPLLVAGLVVGCKLATMGTSTSAGDDDLADGGVAGSSVDSSVGGSNGDASKPDAAGGAGGTSGASGNSGDSGTGASSGHAGEAGKGGGAGASGGAGQGGSAGDSGGAAGGGMAGSAGSSGSSGAAGGGGVSGTGGVGGSSGGGAAGGTGGEAGTAGHAGASGAGGSAGVSGGAGTAGASGTAGSAGASVCTIQINDTNHPNCNSCLQTTCLASCSTCAANAECYALINCMMACGSDSCKQNCWDDHPKGQDDANALAGQKGCTESQCSGSCPAPPSGSCSGSIVGRPASGWFGVMAIGLALAVANRKSKRAR